MRLSRQVAGAADVVLLTDMEATTRPVQFFGLFQLDEWGELRKDGLPVRLQEQPRRILEALLQRPGTLVTREDLRRRLWTDDTVVGFEDGLNNAVNRLRVTLGDAARKPRFIETVGRRGYRFLAPVRVTPVRPAPRVLAVLPLQDLAPEPHRDYLADGMTEALITAVAGIGSVRVISRSSVMRFKGVARPLREIARELGADVLVEGSILMADGRTRLTVRLVDGRSDSHLWARSYERETRDVLALQGELAAAIAEELHLEVTDQARALLSRPRPVEPAAHEAWLKGRYWWNKRTVDGLRRGIVHFKEAIAVDPLYAAAYVGMADCYNSLGTVPLGEPPAQTRPLAAAAASRALGLDPMLAEAHATLGYTQLYGREWDAAERSLRRALVLNPSYAEAHAWNGHLLASRGRLEEAVAAARKAQELDPLSVYIRSTTGFLLHVARRHEEADRELRAALELEADCGIPLLFLGINLLQQGRAPEAVRTLERMVEVSGRNPALIGWLAQGYAAGGRWDAARAAVAEMEAAARQRYVPPASLGFGYLATGDLDAAYRCLADAIDERANVAIYFAVLPAFDGLHRDARFAALLGRLQLPTP
jgi:TolB-like protein/Tfp pilus assembly protein PilF